MRLDDTNPDIIIIKRLRQFACYVLIVGRLALRMLCLAIENILFFYDFSMKMLTTFPEIKQQAIGVDIAVEFFFFDLRLQFTNALLYFVTLLDSCFVSQNCALQRIMQFFPSCNFARCIALCASQLLFCLRNGRLCGFCALAQALFRVDRLDPAFQLNMSLLGRGLIKSLFCLFQRLL